jgi:hypothetical protein
MSLLYTYITHELIHVAVSSLLAYIVFLWFHSKRAGIICFTYGIFMDLDHLFDFFLATNGISFNIVSFFTMDYFTVNGKVFVPLHGWEYVILYLGIGFIKKYRDISISLSFAIIGHLLIDHISYGIKFSEYFILYRLW